MSSPDQQTDLGRREPAADPGRREPYTDQPDQYADQPYRTDQPDAGQASDEPYPPTGEAGAPPDPAHSRLDDPGRDTGTAVETGQGETGQGDTGQPAHDVRPASFDDSQTGGSQTGDSQTGGSQTGDSQTGDSQTGAAPAGRDGGDSRERLVPADRAESYSSRWDAVKGTFVDEPRQAVAQADALVGELLEELEQLFRTQRSDLEQGLDADQTSTEDLRIALRRYRSFFDRLLSL